MARNDIIAQARELRKNQTHEESICWTMLRNRRFEGYKFLRQHPIKYNQHGKDNYFIVDFFCHELSLIIEIDGPIHNLQQDYDKERETILRNMGFSIIRFSNKMVNESLTTLKDTLKKIINKS